jgi:endonuclease YncB( thermonuclease family)
MSATLRLFLGTAISTWLSSAACADSISGRASVVDGDSIEIHGERIHILDIDAPERAQFCFKKSEAIEEGAWPCGQQAALALSDWIGQQNVTCDVSKRVKQDGWSGRCVVAGQDAGEWLAENGWAVPDRNCKCDVVREAAHRARAAQIGIWTSAFTLPWEWRKAH